MITRPIVLAALWFGAGCAAAGGGGHIATPVIDRIEPTHGTVGVAYPIEVTVFGRNFTDSNVVTFGAVTLRPVPSREDGTQLTFHAPKEAPSSGEVPPMPLPPGDYEVTVATVGGTSNIAMFTLLPDTGAAR